MHSARSILHWMLGLPALNKDLFSGNRSPPHSVLMYGPPGNGKSKIVAEIVQRYRLHFLLASASNILASLQGQSERIVSAMFRVAKQLGDSGTPCIIFVGRTYLLSSSLLPFG